MTNKQKHDTGARVGLGADILAGLTILSALPYELGDIGVVIPPEAKPWVAGIALTATVLLRCWKRYLELKTTPR